MNQADNQSIVIEGVSEAAYVFEDLSVQNADAIKGGEGSNANIQNHPHQLSLRVN